MGSALNKALEAIEDANPDALQDVLKGINFNRKIGQRTLDDDTLSDFVSNFEKIPLKDSDFEFPDLLGAAYEWLIKYFADSAGKKAGEFYTPAEVVRICVEVCDPQENMSVYDPTVGSGGMLIQMRDYLQEKGGSADELALYGQEKMGTTWSICKMNMLLHGISHADIRQADTIREPQHLDQRNELKRFDRVVANPPFSQNYIKKELKFAGRFPVMLPSNLFYGTGIPACILVMNKAGAAARDHVLFINADREYREGKAQNHLRPEDIDKIIFAYRQEGDIPAYARRVPKAEIAAEEYNCNIRRYVDNAPPPEPQDVRAHLHGGVPVAEVDSLAHFWQNYAGLRADAFAERAGDAAYVGFAAELGDKREMAEFVMAHPGVVRCHEQFMTALADWWQANLPIVEALAPDAKNQVGRSSRNVYVMRSQLLGSIEAAIAQQQLLTPFQVRGAFANYVDRLKADFKSIAASGWGPELIPDEDILQSQFPDILAELEQAQTRLAELQALFAAAGEEEFEDEEETGVLPADEVKGKKGELKETTAAWRAQLKLVKDLAGNLYTEIRGLEGLPPGMEKRGFYCSEGLTAKSPQFENGGRIVALAAEMGYVSEYIGGLKEAIASGQRALARATSIEESLARHKALEDEVRALRATIKGIEGRRDELVQSARVKISADEARGVIVVRLRLRLMELYAAYLRADQRVCVRAIEAERDEASGALQAFLIELGYE